MLFNRWDFGLGGFRIALSNVYYILLGGTDRYITSDGKLYQVKASGA